MVELDFTVEGAEIERFAAAPTLKFKLHISDATAAAVQNVLLQCQLRIEATRRRYVAGERERLADLFGETHRWEDTLRAMLWTHAAIQVPAFVGETSVDLPILCSFDFNVAATKYFYGLEDGEVPLTFLFSGTVFYRGEDGLLQMAPISWSREAEYRLPVRLWQEMMDAYYSGSVWLRIDRGIFEDLYRLKRRRGFTDWDQTLRTLLGHQREESLP